MANASSNLKYNDQKKNTLLGANHLDRDDLPITSSVFWNDFYDNVADVDLVKREKNNIFLKCINKLGF